MKIRALTLYTELKEQSDLDDWLQEKIALLEKASSLLESFTDLEVWTKRITVNPARDETVRELLKKLTSSPALKGKDPLQGLTGSPHLFGTTSVICGAVGAIRDPPICFRAFFSMFITAITSLSASNPHTEHFIFL